VVPGRGVSRLATEPMVDIVPHGGLGCVRELARKTISVRHVV
jgi:hypothetical protein